MKIFVLILTAMLLGGCASGPSPEQLAQRAYADTYRPMAISGAMKWSDYYSGLYSKMLDAHAPASALKTTDALIGFAQQYEAGSITKEMFEHERRVAINANAQEMEHAAERERARRAAIAASIAAQPPIQNSYQIVRPQPIQSTPMQFQAPEQRRGVTAFWTGKQEMVQTVTHQSGWRCEYSYAGSTFFRIFTSSCPSSVQVE